MISIENCTKINEIIDKCVERYKITKKTHLEIGVEGLNCIEQGTEINENQWNNVLTHNKKHKKLIKTRANSS